jgi:hypothetical protein
MLAPGQKAIRIADAPVLKVYKCRVMKNYDRDILVLYKTDLYNDDLLQREVESLQRILISVERNEAFCIAHELVTRHRITSRHKAILKATGSYHLKPFHFLINKN